MNCPLLFLHYTQGSSRSTISIRYFKFSFQVANAVRLVVCIVGRKGLYVMLAIDPASAVISFIGFTASISTLAALVIDSAKTLYNLQSQLKNAPEDVHRLLRQLQIFEKLLDEIRARSREHGDMGVPDTLQEIWQISATQIEEDLIGFTKVLRSLQRRLNGYSVSSNLVRLRVMKFFYDDDLVKFQRRLSSHHQSMGVIQLFISELVLNSTATVPWY